MVLIRTRRLSRVYSTLAAVVEEALAASGFSTPPGLEDPPATGIVIDATGNDANNGGVLDPVYSFARAQQLATAGQGIFYRGGTYTAYSQLISYSKALNGAAGQRIQIRPYPSDGPGSVIFDGLNRQGAMALIGGEGGIVEQMIFQNGGNGLVGNTDASMMSNDSFGITVSGKYATVRRVHIRGIRGEGSGNRGGFRVRESAERLTLHNCAFTDLTNPNNIASKANVTHFVQMSNDSPSVIYNTHNTTVHSCYFELDNGNGQVMFRQKHALENTGNRLYNCTFNNLATPNTVVGIDLNGVGSWQVDHVLVLNCPVGHDTGGGAAVWQFLTLYTTLSNFRFLGAPVTLTDSIIAASAASWGASGSYNGILRFQPTGTDADVAAALAGDVINRNCYHAPNVAAGARFNFFADNSVHTAGGVYNGLAAWQAATGFDANSIEANPMFGNPGVNDFTLDPGSPAAAMGCYQTGYDPPLTTTDALGW
jgi:hypothetical protein